MTPATVPVRQAEKADIPSWIRLAREVEPLFGPLAEEPGFLHALEKNINRGSAYCVRLGDGPPGVPIIGGMLYSPKPPMYRIGWLAVAWSSRRGGVGSALVRHAVRISRPPGVLLVTTFGDDNPDGRPARRLYMRCGFIPAETQPPGSDGGSRQLFRLPLHE